MQPPLRPHLRTLAAAGAIAAALLVMSTGSARAQGVAAPQASWQASPQASAQAPACACYYPTGYCPFPTGYCAFPAGNCSAPVNCLYPTPQAAPQWLGRTAAPRAVR